MLVQKQVVDALMKPEAYEEETGHIELIQTHISFVFLTDCFAYKVKKAVDLGFLDFTTLEKRRFFCEEELELN
jgi:aminoglycoside phosphotransferase family enzyme